jgi:hypothetical protein
MQLFSSLKTHTIIGSTMFVGLDQQNGRGSKNRPAENILCYRGNRVSSSQLNLGLRGNQSATAAGELCYRGAFTRSLDSSVKSNYGTNDQPRQQNLCYRGLNYSK